MSKVRVHELAKEIDKTSKDIMEYLNGNGADLKSHMSFLTDQQVEAVKKKFGKAAPAGDAPKKKDHRAGIPSAEHPGRPETQGGKRRSETDSGRSRQQTRRKSRQKGRICIRSGARARQ